VTEAQGASGRWIYWIPVLAVMALIFVASSQSGLRISDDADIDKPFRVSAHLLAFASLAGTLLVAFSRGRAPRLRDAALAFGITFIYALSDEWHQSFVADRKGRLDDVMTDAIGALIGIGVAWVVLTLGAKRRAVRATRLGGGRRP